MGPISRANSGAVLSREDSSIGDFDFLGYAEQSTGYAQVYFATAIMIVAWIIVFAVFGAHTFGNFVAFVYPAYMSFKTLESSDANEQMAWLTYWMLYAIFSAFESVADKMLFWLPYYGALKLLFLIWCFLPSTRGSGTIYYYILRPLLKHNEESIDRQLDGIAYLVRQITIEVKSLSSNALFGAFSYLTSFCRRKKKET